MRAFVDGVTASATGAIAGAAFVLGRRAVVDVPTAIIATVTLAILLVVRRVPDSDRELLRYLDELGLVPGERVEVVSRQPFDGPIFVRARGAEHAISRDLAARIGVE